MDVVFPAVEEHMMLCLKGDENSNIEKVCSLDLVEPLEKSSYGYGNSIEELLHHYVDDLPVRKQRTINLDKYQHFPQTGNRFIEMRKIIKMNCQKL